MENLTETQNDRLELNYFRTGWIRWCLLDDKSDCVNAEELLGWEFAADCNEDFGNRPRQSEARELGAGDIKEAKEHRALRSRA